MSTTQPSAFDFIRRQSKNRNTVYNARCGLKRTHALTSRISYICMNNAQETQNTNVLVHAVIFWVFHKTWTGIVCSRRRSLGPTDSHERVSIFISLYYLLTFSPRNRFFFHGPLLHTHLLLFKKKKRTVCVRILFYT